MAEIADTPILLLGGSGMLGDSFTRALPPDISTLPRESLDVSQPTRLAAAVADLAPKVIINCVADTQVDAAEATPGPAFAANALLPALLAQSARRLGAVLVHFSSTGCYGDNQANPYAPHSDFSPLHPTTAHHRSKAQGELLVREAGCAHLILRLGWLYGGSSHHRKNFVGARIRDARQKTVMASDPYQLGSPTHVDDVVRQTVALISSGVEGTFNCVSTGAVSRYDYTARILQAAGLATRLVPTRFTRPAPVAFNETAVNDKLTLLGLNNMPDWAESLTRYIETSLAEEERIP